MREIIEHQASDGNLFQVQHSGGHKQVRQWRVGGMKSQRNKRLESVSFILKSTQTDKMVGPVFFVLNVAVEHRGIRFEADFVRRACGIEPLVAVNLVVADNAAHALIEDFSSATG